MRASMLVKGARALVLFLSITPFAAAQDPELPLARALILALAPENDDADARTKDLLRAALAAPRSPAAAALVAATEADRYELADPKAVLAILDEDSGSVRHGLLQIELDDLRNDMNARVGKPERAIHAGFATSIAVVGPFGDAGSRFLRVPFAPDAGFPAMGAKLTGRFGEVTPRVVDRKDPMAGLRLRAKETSEGGSYYALWRVDAAEATEGFLEVRYEGPILARIDGIDVGSYELIDPSNRGAAVHWFPVRLTRGQHEIVVKTGDLGGLDLWLRLCDGNGLTLPQAKQIPADAPRTPTASDDPRGSGTLRTSAVAFAAAAEQASGDDRAALRIAAATEHKRMRNHDDALRHLLTLHKEPPTDPAAKLALAELWTRATEFPDELRNARARELQNAATQELPELHTAAVLARVKKLEDQDQREQALRLLRKAIDGKRAGPKVFELCRSVLNGLRFEAELPTFYEQWRVACPGDPTPLFELAERSEKLGAKDKAFQLREEARRTRIGNAFLARSCVDAAIELGRIEDAARIVEETAAAVPPASSARDIAELRLRLAEARDDAASRSAAIDQFEHAGEPYASLFSRIADMHVAAGEDNKALAAIEASLALDSDQPDLRRVREALGGPAREGADFARFRRDGDAAIAAFQKGANEEGASTSLLIDQRIVELLPDGSALVEIHELRSVNDLQGVEALRSADPPARADELLLLRTVGKDGKTYVPTRVEGGFSMPRLEPGAFVEWRYRERIGAPGADPLQLENFLFASQQEALYLSEWVLIAPDKGRGELRTRNLVCERETIALDGGRTATILRRTNVARMPQETSTPPSESILPMAGFGEDAASWPELRDMHANLLARTRTTPVLEEFVATLFADKTGDTQRIATAWEFCQRDIGDGEASNATEILLRKKGNRFLLMVGLLRAGGVPMDFAASESARVELTGQGVPLFADGSDARVPTVRLLPRDGASAWLFADSPRHWPIGVVPAHRGGARAFVLRDDSYELLRLPAPATAVQDLEVSGECAFEPTTTKLKAVVHLHGQAGFSVAEQVRKAPADRQKLAARQIAQQFLQGWRMRNAACIGLEPPGQELSIEVEATGPAAQASGEGRFLAALPMPTMSMRASFGDRDERTLPLQLDTDLWFRHRVRLTAGEGRRFGALPPPASFSFGPLDYQLTLSKDGDAVLATRSVRLRPGTIEPALYADWIRVLAAIDQREEQRLEILGKAPAPK